MASTIALKSASASFVESGRSAADSVRVCGSDEEVEKYWQLVSIVTKAKASDKGETARTKA
jgi:hypothetical protein